MLSDISSRLMQVIEQRRRKEKTEQDLRQVERDLKGTTDQYEQLEKQLRKERVDVERLERLSLTGLFYSVLGSREQQVEKERQELLAAQLKYEQARRMVEMLRADQTRLARQLDDLHGVEEEHRRLLEKKEDLLRQANAPVVGELLRISEQIANFNAEAREINEALQAADEVLAGLDQVIASLESAEGWGTWDMLGGGMISTAIKHSRIDDARKAVQDVQAALKRFRRELADVQQHMDLEIEIDGLDIFADFFFDGLIMDWIVQSKIQKSLERSRQAKKDMLSAVSTLKKARSGALSQARGLDLQRAAIIEQS